MPKYHVIGNWRRGGGKDRGCVNSYLTIAQEFTLAFATNCVYKYSFEWRLISECQCTLHKWPHISVPAEGISWKAATPLLCRAWCMIDASFPFSMSGLGHTYFIIPCLSRNWPVIPIKTLRCNLPRAPCNYPLCSCPFQLLQKSLLLCKCQSISWCYSFHAGALVAAAAAAAALSAFLT